MEPEKSVKTKPKKLPLGVMILGGLNCFIGLSTLANYLSITPDNFQKFSQALEANRFSQEVTFQQFKAASSIFLLLAALFIASGVGVILKKNWARKITLYFSFIILIMILLSTLNQPGLISFFIIHAVYFAALIFYFTNKRVEEHFKSSLSKNKNQES